MRHGEHDVLLAIVHVAHRRSGLPGRHIDAAGIRMSIGYLPSIRLVTHLDIDDAAIARTIEVISDFFRGREPREAGE